LKRILIIRSVSYQQLDKNLNALVALFPGAEYSLLTHSHGLEQARTYQVLSQIIDYGSRKNFSLFHLPRSLHKGEGNYYDLVVVPVTNLSGVGFFNVFLMALRIDSRHIYICNMRSEIWEVPRRRLWWKGVKAAIFSLLAGVLVMPFFILVIPVIGIWSLFGRKRK